MKWNNDVKNRRVIGWDSVIESECESRKRAGQVMGGRKGTSLLVDGQEVKEIVTGTSLAVALMGGIL